MKQLEELKLSYRRTFNTDDGEKVLKDLKSRFGYVSKHWFVSVLLV